MPSDLQITNIRDQANANSAITIGSDGQITVNQNNPTLTLGTNATISKSGMVVNSGAKIYSSGSGHTITVTSYEAVQDYHQISCNIGNTIIFSFSGFALADRVSGNDVKSRFGYVRTYQHTSAVAKDATTLGTSLNEYLIGFEFDNSPSHQAGSYNDMHVTGMFTATNTTHYLGLAFKSSTTETQFIIYDTSTSKLTLNYYEIQGDVIT
jgi:hypothetical protein